DASVAQLDTGAPGSHAPDDAARVLQLLRRTMDHDRIGDAAASLAMMLANALSCDRVSVGLVHRGGLRIAGSSDGWESEARALLPDVNAVLAEALDNGSTVSCPAPDGSTPGLVAAHLQ